MKLFTTQTLGASSVFAAQLYTPAVNLPIMHGLLEPFGVGVTRFGVRWEPATVQGGAISGYEVSLDTGAYLDVGLVDEYVFSWLAPGSAHTAAVRAYDNQGRYSAPLSRAVALHEAPPKTVRRVLINGRVDFTDPIVLVGVFPRNQ